MVFVRQGYRFRAFRATVVAAVLRRSGDSAEAFIEQESFVLVFFLVRSTDGCQALLSLIAMLDI